MVGSEFGLEGEDGFFGDLIVGFVRVGVVVVWFGIVVVGFCDGDVDWAG